MWLPLVRPLLGTWPATQACALTVNPINHPFGSQAGAQSPEPHQPGYCCLRFKTTFLWPLSERSERRELVLAHRKSRGAQFELMLPGGTEETVSWKEELPLCGNLSLPEREEPSY